LTGILVKPHRDKVGCQDRIDTLSCCMLTGTNDVDPTTLSDMFKDFHRLRGDNKSVRILRGYLRLEGLFGEYSSTARTYEPTTTEYS
jgi:hypothetical protein